MSNNQNQQNKDSDVDVVILNQEQDKLPRHEWTHRSIEDNSSNLNNLFFVWTNNIVNFGNKYYFEERDLFEQSEKIKCEQTRKEFIQKYDELKQKYKQSCVFQTCWRLNSHYIYKAITCSLLGNFAQFAGPLILEQLLNYLMQDKNKDYNISRTEAYLLATSMLIIYVIRSFLMQHCFNYLNYGGYRTFLGLQAKIMDKTMKLSTSSRSNVDSGKILSLSTMDGQSIYGFFQMGSFILVNPMMILISFVFICYKIGYFGLIGIPIIILGGIVNSQLSKYMSRYRKQELQFSDQRTKAMTEFIGGIRILKYYGWEEFAMKKIFEIRKKETWLLLKETVLRGVISFWSSIIPTLMIIIIFSLHDKYQEKLTPQSALVTLSLFNIVSQPIQTLGFIFFYIINIRVSLKRLNLFFDLDEKQIYDDSQQGQKNIDFQKDIPKGAISIQNADFDWQTEHSKKQAEELQKLLDYGKPKKKNAKQPKESTKKIQQIKTSISKIPDEKNSLKQPLLDNDIEQNFAKKIDLQPDEKEPILKNINLEVKPGEYVAVLAQVGHGKSSLGSSILQEMFNINNKAVKVNGRVAYCSQQSWLLSTTLKENILFGRDLDQAFYNYVIEICQLQDDINILPLGDSTQIGEKGINLSGGQKARIQLARAVYSDADIYVIDDILASLDAHVSKEVFNHVFRGEFKGKNKTVVFLTHSIHYASQADRIIVLKNGEIIENGTLQQLQQIEDSEYNRLSLKSTNDNSQVENQESQETSKISKVLKDSTVKSESSKDSFKKPTQADIKKFAIEEQKASGGVDWKVYLDYIKAGGLFWSSVAILLSVMSQFQSIGTDLWIGYWSGDILHWKSTEYILVYGLIGFGGGLLVLMRSFAFSVFGRIAGNKLQNQMLNSIFRSPIQWFDTTPSGRILNRTNKDQDDVDNTLPWVVSQCILCFLSIGSQLILTGGIIPTFFIFFLIAFAVYARIIYKYIKTARELKRIGSVSRSPIFTQISEVAHGYIIIRNFEKQQHFMKLFDKKCDNFVKADFNNNATNRWINLRSDLYSGISIGATALLVVGSKDMTWISSNTQAAFFGIALTSVMKIVSQTSYIVKILSETEIRMNACERILEYINKPEQEKDWIVPGVSESLQEWPSHGQYELKEISYKYRPELPYVLNKLSFSIQSNEKIGVVGRTGSGKSTLTLGLLRILELADNPDSNKPGFIKLDGIDISQIGLHQLRHNITMIPQDPILFSGTIRSNVDPFEQYSDEQIIEALKKTQIWGRLKAPKEETESQNEENKKKESDEIKSKKVNFTDQSISLSINNQNESFLHNQNTITNIDINQDEPKKLQMLVQNGGDNFSQGERQLICMSRALIRNSKVLIMDEATASIDELTDHFIQQMIQNELKETTVITIAHRLNTIMQYDKVLVLDYGNLKEFDSPENLLDNEDSYFKQLVSQNGQEFEKKMRLLASSKNKQQI